MSRIVGKNQKSFGYLNRECQDKKNYCQIIGDLYSVIDRIVMGQISKFFQIKGNLKEFMEVNEKAFKKNIEGCTEHATRVKLLIADALTLGRSLLIGVLDCREILTSVLHH
jgi:hypothetical protein